LFQRTGFDAHKEMHELTNRLTGPYTCAATGLRKCPWSS